MIRTEKGYLKAPCNSCGSDTDIIILINYKNNFNGGMAINLCDNCRKELIKKLKELNGNEKRRSCDY